ncbi:MAG TPA: glycosyltransferase family 25 protein [Chitinophagaceae bacterium]|jgi:GR25 family glycosyltransferase involved in LPS biosynthesis
MPGRINNPDNNMHNDLAPIVLFAYKRKDTLRQTVEALRVCTLASECDLYVFADGAKGKKDQKEVTEVRNYLKTISGFKSISFNLSEKNRGISHSVIEGVNKIFSKNDKVVVLEDDIVVSKNFIVFMNENLLKYQNQQSVFSISGYNYPFRVKDNEKLDAFFLPRSSSWGWATWRDRWCDLDWEIKEYRDFSSNKDQIREFHRGGSDLFRMLKKQQIQQMDVWDVRWVYNQFRRNGLTVYPTISKVRNVGFGQDATNTNTYNRYISEFDGGEKEDFTLPECISIDPFYHRQLLKFYSLFSRIKSRLKTILFKIGLIKRPFYFVYSSILGLHLSIDPDSSILGFLNDK